MRVLWFYFTGIKAACAEKFPRELYPERGRTEFTKLRLNTRLLLIQTDDFTFSKTLGPNAVRYVGILYEPRHQKNAVRTFHRVLFSVQSVLMVFINLPVPMPGPLARRIVYFFC